ncbi:uncharacterized protein LOC101887566 [Musca domestica]|uniref:Uncharacterized protein LOC101887566 n=1 Tax=Musca domestica TaxID=7370 RepID=A0A9J7CP83_MUSDO|nr:uncharacterized protein LOC101887566 [Musca domestica]
MSSSIVWVNYKNLQICDIHEKQRPLVKDYILKNFLSNELHQILGYHENIEFQEDLQRILQHLLENDSSIMVWDSENDEIRGVALMKCMLEKWYSWTALKVLIRNSNLEELIDLSRNSLKNMASEIREQLDSLHIFYYFFESDLCEDFCFVAKFFQAISLVGQHMQMPRITYMALGRREGELFEENGFQEMQRLLYSMYVYRGRRPFDHLRDLNEMYGCLYEKKLENLKPFRELEIRHGEDKEKEGSEK